MMTLKTPNSTDGLDAGPGLNAEMEALLASAAHMPIESPNAAARGRMLEGILAAASSTAMETGAPANGGAAGAGSGGLIWAAMGTALLVAGLIGGWALSSDTTDATGPPNRDEGATTEWTAHAGLASGATSGPAQPGPWATGRPGARESASESTAIKTPTPVLMEELAERPPLEPAPGIIAAAPIAPATTPEAIAPDPPPSRAERFRAERALIDRARSAFRIGNHRRAIQATRQHRQKFPRGRLAEERDALYIRALAASGSVASAKTRAWTFLKRYPGSIHRATVTRAAQIATPAP